MLPQQVGSLALGCSSSKPHTGSFSVFLGNLAISAMFSFAWDTWASAPSLPPGVVWQSGSWWQKFPWNREGSI